MSHNKARPQRSEAFFAPNGIPCSLPLISTEVYAVYIWFSSVATKRGTTVTTAQNCKVHVHIPKRLTPFAPSTAFPDQRGVHGNGRAAGQSGRGGAFIRTANASACICHGQEQDFSEHRGPFPCSNQEDARHAVSLGVVGARSDGRGSTITGAHYGAHHG